MIATITTMIATIRTSLCVILFHGLASAQLLTPIAQERSVTGRANLCLNGTETSDSELITAPDFGPFVAAAGANVQNPSAEACAGGNQDSEIVSNSFIASGSAFSDSFVSSGLWEADAFGSSRATLTFQLTARARYQIVGQLTSTDYGDSSALLRFANDGSFIDGANAFDRTIALDRSGVLEPGEYDISFSTVASTCAYGGFFNFGFGEYAMALHLTPFVDNYCEGAVNSTGAGASLAATGTTSIAANDFSIEATGLPSNAFGVVFYGPNQIQTTFGDGFRCVGGLTQRVLPIVQADGAGTLVRGIDFTTGPASSGSNQILPDSTWNFQFWYRDPMGPGGSGFNTSDGLSVMFEQ